jgi:hypothetical protein
MEFLLFKRDPPDLMQLMIDAEADNNRHGSLEISVDEDKEVMTQNESANIELRESVRRQLAEELSRNKLTAEVQHILIPEMECTINESFFLGNQAARVPFSDRRI